MGVDSNLGPPPYEPPSDFIEFRIAPLICEKHNIMAFGCPSAISQFIVSHCRIARNNGALFIHWQFGNPVFIRLALYAEVDPKMLQLIGGGLIQFSKGANQFDWNALIKDESHAALRSI
jgi:hypothetical protein